MPFFSPVWWRAPAKEELFRYPIVRNILASWGAFPVRRGKHDFEAMVNMAEMLKEGVIVIAPEGRRSRDGRLLPGRPGVGKIIHDARPQKVIPVVLQGTERVLPPGRILPRLFQKVRICYGAPMDLSPYYGLPHSREVSQRIVDEVMARIAEMKREL
jgi:1-acyl-sn-glycerol-3-phosphate acyltransferase